jgi:hypothetical protein
MGKEEGRGEGVGSWNKHWTVPVLSGCLLTQKNIDVISV